jgi:hypothetical protein
MGLVNRERTAWQVRIDRSAWTFQPGNVSQNNSAGKSWPGETRRDKPAGTGQPGLSDQTGQPGQISSERSVRTVQREKSAQIGYSG